MRQALDQWLRTVTRGLVATQYVKRVVVASTLGRQAQQQAVDFILTNAGLWGCTRSRLGTNAQRNIEASTTLQPVAEAAAKPLHIKAVIGLQVSGQLAQQVNATHARELFRSHQQRAEGIAATVQGLPLPRARARTRVVGLQ